VLAEKIGARRHAGEKQGLAVIEADVRHEARRAIFRTRILRLNAHGQADAAMDGARLGEHVLEGRGMA